MARRITYDRSADSLVIEGPIRVLDAAGNLVTADRAEMDQALENGILTGARLVLDQQLQLASVEARRVEGRYTQLSRVVATSCQVCGPNGVPLWQIRAARVIHDQEAQQLYFDNATFHIGRVPVFYFPRIRLPDPTLARARGFLIPTFRSTTLLGLGLKLPYFIPIGDHQDITLTPYLSPKTRTLEFRYRRAFHNGDLTLRGALSRDTLEPDLTRGYLFAEGTFDLPRDYRLTFDLATVSDDSYLNDYGTSSEDRLASSIALTRVRRDTFVQANIVNFQTLRDSESNDTQPRLILDYRIEKRFFPARLGGELRLAAETHGHLRPSKLEIDGPDADSAVDGRDVARLNAEASWRDRWTLGPGLRLGLSTHLWADRFLTAQDATSDRDVTSLTPGVAAELRWPLQRRGSNGGRTLLEPVLQLGWTGGERRANPNDESTRVEFDEANLLSLSRFPAPDRKEYGTTLAAGLRWMHQAPTGWTAALTLGQIWRAEEDPEFSLSSGLSGASTSDLLIAARVAAPFGLTLSARGLLDRASEFNKAEALASWSNERIQLNASYLLLVRDDYEDRDDTQSEWTFDSTYRVTRHWATSTEARYDLADQRLDRLGLGLQYRNECIEVGFSARRNYASASNLEPSTDFDLTVALKGFSTGGSAKEYRRTCAF
jgi:LPS-assembly protein